MQLSQIESSLVKMQTHYTKAVGQKELLEASLLAVQKKLAAIQADITRGELVQALFTKTSEYARAQLKQRIEATVTAGIQAIFQNDDEFFVEIGEFRGQPAANWRVKINSPVKVNGKIVAPGGIVDPEDADGGGLSDIVSSTLRLSILETSRPKPEGPCLLDEPGRNLSGQSSDSDYLPNLATFIKEYAKQSGRQVFLVTHEDPLMEVADVSYRVTQNTERISEVKKVG